MSSRAERGEGREGERRQDKYEDKDTKEKEEAHWFVLLSPIFQQFLPWVEPTRNQLLGEPEIAHPMAWGLAEEG